MDLIAERLVGKKLMQIQHKAEHDTTIVFEDGAITAWTEVRVELAFSDKPAVVKHLNWTTEWCTIHFDAGSIGISRIPNWPSPECFIYGTASEPALLIVDRGEE
jgi:hypothetical protein